MEQHRNIIAVIAARGGSRGIPRKNARLLNGKPLMAYAIEVAKASRHISRVVVSTDDPEIGEIGRRWHADVFDRPEELARAEVGLDETIAHVYGQVCAAGDYPDYVVTLQPTSPLLRVETLDHAIERCINEGRDTVISVINEPHLAWGQTADGGLMPLYESRKNRQFLPAYYRETGAFVITRAEVLKLSGGRFGEDVSVVELAEGESLDIDSYFDWWLVEKSLSRRRILFHVAGSREIGLGHVGRGLVLAYRLNEHHLEFLVNDRSEMGRRLIERSFFPVHSVAEGEELDFIVEHRPNLVINDILDTSEEYMQGLRKTNISTINFEDLGPGSQWADVLINAMYDTYPGLRQGTLYQGHRYCCLRDEFFHVERKPFQERIDELLILFGGTDPSDLTLQVLPWIEESSYLGKVTVILGPGYYEPDRVRSLTSHYKNPINVVTDSRLVSRHMAEADLAITSAGRTVFELAALGVPMMVLSQNEREMHHVFARNSPGVINMGLGKELTRREFGLVFGQILRSPLLRRKMQQILLNEDVYGGTERVLEIIRSMIVRGEK